MGSQLEERIAPTPVALASPPRSASASARRHLSPAVPAPTAANITSPSAAPSPSFSPLPPSPLPLSPTAPTPADVPLGMASSVTAPAPAPAFFMVPDKVAELGLSSQPLSLRRLRSPSPERDAATRPAGVRMHIHYVCVSHRTVCQARGCVPNARVGR